MSKPWSAAEVALLERAWGERGADAIARELGRSERAVEAMAAQRKLGAPNRGRLTPYGIQREFGFCRIRVVKACERLGIRFGRALAGPGVARERSPSRRRYIPEDRLEELLDFLRAWPDGERLYSPRARRTDSRMWGTGQKPAACLSCGRTDRPHRACGWCVACASREGMRKLRAKRMQEREAAAAAGAQRAA